MFQALCSVCRASSARSPALVSFARGIQAPAQKTKLEALNKRHDIKRMRAAQSMLRAKKGQSSMSSPPVVKGVIFGTLPRPHGCVAEGCPVCLEPLEGILIGARGVRSQVVLGTAAGTHAVSPLLKARPCRGSPRTACRYGWHPDSAVYRLCGDAVRFLFLSCL